ncbi:hypothetical protein ACHAWC_000428, partial [Mediolabrus comicus]
MQPKTTTLAVLLAAACSGSTTFGFAPTQQQPPRASSTSLNFFGGQKKAASAAKSSPLADEAVQTYLSKYPSDQKTVSFFFESWGMPESYQAPKSSESIFSRKNEELASTFNTIASIYGD